MLFARLYFDRIYSKRINTTPQLFIFLHFLHFHIILCFLQVLNNHIQGVLSCQVISNDVQRVLSGCLVHLLLSSPRCLARLLHLLLFVRLLFIPQTLFPIFFSTLLLHVLNCLKAGVSGRLLLLEDDLSEEVCEDEHGHAEEEGGGHQHDPREDVLGLVEDVVELQPVEVGPVPERLLLQRAVVLVICNLQPDAALNKNN